VNRQTTSPFRLLVAPVGICLWLVLLTLVVYLPVIHYGFVGYDDNDYFYDNPHVLGGFTWTNVQWAFTSGEDVNWHPLTWLSLMLDAQLFGPGATAPHLTNILLHAANAVLLFVLLRGLTGAHWRSAAVALLFAVHPLHVESVAWVSERKDMLSGFFALLALLSYTHYAGPQMAHRAWLFYGIALAFFVCGLLSKPMLVTLPLVMLLLDFWPLQRFGTLRFSRLVIEKIPFFLLVMVASLVTFMVQQKGGAVPPLSRFPLGLRFENVFISYARYLAKIFWPVNLATPYPAPVYEPAIFVIFSIALFAGICLAAVALKKQFPFAFTGWFWFAGMLVPVIGLVQVGAQAMADRYVYLPIVGVFLIVVWGIGEVCSKWHPSQIVIICPAAFLLIACVLCARQQVAVWKDDETLFGHAVAVTRDNYFADLALAHWYENHGQTNESLDYYYEAARISPGDATDLYNAANAFAKLGRWEQAITIYRRALLVSTNQPDILNNLGFAFAQNHQLPEAADCFQEVLKLNPNSVGARNNLAAIFFAQGNYAVAAQQYQAALQLAPGNPRLIINLADTLVRLNETNDAVKCYQRAWQLEPGNPQIRAKLQALGVQP
jgi:protein O-mannosyl-transferase